MPDPAASDYEEIETEDVLLPWTVAFWLLPAWFWHGYQVLGLYLSQVGIPLGPGPAPDLRFLSGWVATPALLTIVRRDLPPITHVWTLAGTLVAALVQLVGSLRYTPTDAFVWVSVAVCACIAKAILDAYAHHRRWWASVDD
jgi:hypothetical protein